MGNARLFRHGDLLGQRAAGDTDRGDGQLAVGGVVQAHAAEIQRQLFLQRADHHLQDAGQVLALADGARGALQQVHALQLRLQAQLGELALGDVLQRAAHAHHAAVLHHRAADGAHPLVHAVRGDELQLQVVGRAVLLRLAAARPRCARAIRRGRTAGPGRWLGFRVSGPGRGYARSRVSRCLRRWPGRTPSRRPWRGARFLPAVPRGHCSSSLLLASSTVRSRTRCSSTWFMERNSASTVPRCADQPGREQHQQQQPRCDHVHDMPQAPAVIAASSVARHFRGHHQVGVLGHQLAFHRRRDAFGDHALPVEQAAPVAGSRRSVPAGCVPTAPGRGAPASAAPVPAGPRSIPATDRRPSPTGRWSRAGAAAGCRWRPPAVSRPIRLVPSRLMT